MQQAMHFLDIGEAAARAARERNKKEVQRYCRVYSGPTHESSEKFGGSTAEDPKRIATTSAEDESLESPQDMSGS